MPFAGRDTDRARLRFSKARVTRRPSKTFAYMMLNRELRRHTAGLGIDAAAGYLGTFPYFRTESYLAFDVDEVGLASGSERFPDARVELCDLEEARRISDRGDEGAVVVCVETLRINKEFDDEQLSAALDTLARLTRAGGTLIFNVGEVGGTPIRHTEEFVLAQVSRNFTSVRTVRYGALFDELSTRGWGYVSLALAHLMRWFSPLRTAFGRRHRFTLVICDSRVASVTGSDDRDSAIPVLP